jgi:hypothetical protein
LVETFRVGLLLTERCNIACSHCWFSSGPERTATMAMGEALDYIEQACKIPTVEWISLTGGEPFLLPDMLKRLVRHASNRGLRTECVTNCFWAETEEVAVAILGELIDAGLDVINVSADDFHQRHIPFEKVRNCYGAATSLGLRVVIMCARSRTSTLGIGKIREMLGDEGIQVVGGPEPEATVSALAVETGFVPAGRGATIPREEWPIGGSSVEGPCRDVLRDIGIAPSGMVLPCCSAASQIEGATLGNARKNRLAKMIEVAGGLPLYKALSTVGPAGLAELLGSGRRRGYVNRCHLCYEVLSDLELHQALRPLQITQSRF